MLSERNVERQDGRLLQGERKAIKLQKTEQRREGLKRRSELTGEERAHAEERIRSVLTVSYTHLTLPTKLEV